MKYFIANWKANHNLSLALDWSYAFLKKPLPSDHIKVVICPPLPLLYPLKSKIEKQKNIYLGAQDISSFENGSYTGEVTAKTLQGLIDYVIIGHSERRKYFNETDEILSKKVKIANKYGIESIFCIRDNKDPVPSDVKILAYEPVYAIGSGNNEPVEKVLEMKRKLNLPKGTLFLYGGSVNVDNIADYLRSSEIDGFLIGSSCLNPLEFRHIIDKI